MNDRYLFRGKRVDDGEWVIGYLYITHNGEYEISSYNADFDIERMTSVVIPETVGQCTGQSDKNGKLISDGDILFVETPCVGWSKYVLVRFIYTKFYAVTDKGYMDLQEILWNEPIVCGNVYDNPGLLECDKNGKQ